MFDPKSEKYPYPLSTDGHYLIVKKDDGTVFDADYPYIDRSLSFRIKQGLARALLYAVVFPASYVRLGLRIAGRNNLKRYKDVLDRGFITVSNHVHMWDYIAVMNAFKPRKPYLLVWAPNIRGENGRIVRLVGGIPIPDHGTGGTKAYLKAVHGLLDGGGMLHVYSEGSMWEYYRPIRPFKLGAAYLAVENNKPILPLAFSYRRPNWIRRNIFRQTACLTLRIGEPLFPDNELPKKERKRDLTVRSHNAVCRLAGISPEDSIYPPIFDKSERVDYYTTEYGKDYKGSH